jgi:hypothetical protein
MSTLGEATKRTIERTAASAAGIAIALAVGVASLPAHADGTKPYGDNVTAHTADGLHGTHRGAWLATVLDEGGYHAKRHAEEVKVPAGHGRRWLGVIHVPAGNGNKAARALSGVWFARAGTRFVLPLRSNDYTNGGTGSTYHKAAMWAVKRLDSGWKVVSP